MTKHLLRYRQCTRRHLEAGGQLYAVFDRGTITLEKATGPHRSDKRYGTAFIPNRAAERREIRRLFMKGLHYVGDWHTHPQVFPKPSRVDLHNFSEIVRLSRHELNGFILVIVGTAAPPQGLYVTICDGTNFFKLSPLV